MTEDMQEEEEILQATVKKNILLKRIQGISGMKAMLGINLNIFSFLHLLVLLHRIRGMVGWLIVGALITSLQGSPL